MNKIYQKTFPGGKNAGFTLIELLVVVLIIGILTAIAVPQYQAAVLKSRLSQSWVMARAIYNAEQTCKMANGKFCSISDLDIDLGTGTVEDITDPYERSVFRREDFVCSVSLSTGSVICSFYVRGFSFDNPAINIRKEGVFCLAYNDTVSHQVCKSMGGEFYSTGFNTEEHNSTYTYYKLD